MPYILKVARHGYINIAVTSYINMHKYIYIYIYVIYKYNVYLCTYIYAYLYKVVGYNFLFWPSKRIVVYDTARSLVKKLKVFKTDKNSFKRT